MLMILNFSCVCVCVCVCVCLIVYGASVNDVHSARSCHINIYICSFTVFVAALKRYDENDKVLDVVVQIERRMLVACLTKFV